MVEKTLEPLESICVATGCLVGISESCRFTIDYVGSLRNAVFGGRGLFSARITGPGEPASVCYSKE